MILGLHGIVSSASRTPDPINITVTFAAPVTASSVIPKMKYNKSKAILFEFDDDSIYLLTAWDKLGVTYYTDGCGNNKNYSCGLAVNAKNNFNDFEWAGGSFVDKCTYAQRDALIPFGLDIMNHGFYHEQTGNFNNGTDVYKNFVDNDNFILTKDGGYKMNGMVVPASYAGYHSVADAYGYLFGSSQGTNDSYTFYPQFNPLGQINSTPKVKYSARRRGFSDIWNAGDITTAAQWPIMNSLFSGSNDFFEFGSHNIGDGVNFGEWIDSIVAQANDTALFQSMREFMEYKHIKDYITKTEQVAGNTMTITLDYSTVANKNISWYDLSLLVTSNQAITNVSIDRVDFTLSYNATTKLINVMKRKTNWA